MFDSIPENSPMRIDKDLHTESYALNQVEENSKISDYYLISTPTFAIRIAQKPTVMKCGSQV